MNPNAGTAFALFFLICLSLLGAGIFSNGRSFRAFPIVFLLMVLSGILIKWLTGDDVSLYMIVVQMLDRVEALVKTLIDHLLSRRLY